MEELTFIHSIIDRSPIVLVQIPLKTARFRSFSRQLSLFVLLLLLLRLIYSVSSFNDHRPWRPFQLQNQKATTNNFMKRPVLAFNCLYTCAHVISYQEDCFCQGTNEKKSIPDVFYDEKAQLWANQDNKTIFNPSNFLLPPNQIRKLLVSAVGKYMTSHGLRKLRDGPKTLTQTSESVSNQPTNQLTGIGARDGYASKNRHRKGLGRRISRTICLQPQVKTGTGASDSRTGSGVRWQLDWSQIELILLKYVQHKDDWVLVITRLGQLGQWADFKMSKCCQNYARQGW